MLSIIRDILHQLKPAGDDGFEGLIGAVIFGITDIPCRLAKSGTQFGIDGASAFPGDAICFEAKLYKGTLNKEQIVTKVAELGVYKGAADILWVLGATTPVASQDTELLLKIASLHGISVLILDWSSNELPSLVVALAMARQKVVPFLIKTLNLENNGAELVGAISAALAHEDFDLISKKLRSQFSAVELATENARRANKEWLRGVFSEKNMARNKLGQPVAPLYDSNVVLTRSHIIDAVEKKVDSNPKPIFLLGEEGCGKSWVAASVMERFSGVSIFISAELLDDMQASEENIFQLLVTTLASQCGQLKNDEVVIKRWHKRLEGWEQNFHSSRLLVVLDGLNQRPLLTWHKIINVLQGTLSSIGGCLIVTSRPQLFNKKIKEGLAESFSTVSICNWSEAERNQLLEANGVTINSLDPVTITSLLNPRLLGIALEVLPLGNHEAWQGLTTDRLLFEHLRLSQRDNVEPETPDELARKISADASQAIDKLKHTFPEKPLLFQSDTEYVAEGRFYEVVQGPGRRYKLRGEGLTLALGYALVDRVWEANYNGEDLSEALAKLVEPISALDRTTEVFLAGLTVCALDEDRFSDCVFITILNGFARLQNIDSQRYMSFRNICYRRFNAFLASLECCFLNTSNVVNIDWLKEVALEAKSDDKRWISLSSAVSSWLGYYSKQPEHSFRSYPQDDHDKWLEKVKVNKEKISIALENLSSFELELIAEMEEKEGQLDQLASLAMELLADKPLAPFAKSFLKWGMSIGINSGNWPPTKEFQHLANFNLVDWTEMSRVFRESTLPLRREETSRVGRWTLVRMLLAIGTHQDAVNAVEITDQLRSREGFKAWRLVEKYCETDPCDPDSERPGNIEETSKRFEKIDVDELYSGDFLEASEGGRFLKDSLIGMARFCPDIVISKYKELLATWPNRTGSLLGQLSLNGSNLTPLISAALAEALFNELVVGDNFKTVEKNNRLVILKVLWFISKYLKPQQQLEVMLLPDPECYGYLMDMTSNFKPFEEDIFSKKFSDICSSEKKEAIIVALAFLRYAATPRDSITTDNILRLMSYPDTRVRACIFDLIVHNNITQGVEALYNSEWSAHGENVEAYEEFYGSQLLVKAITQGVAQFLEVFERCSVKVLISSIGVFRVEEQNVILKIVDAAFDYFMESSTLFKKPVFNVVFRENQSGGPSYLSLDGLNHLHQRKHLFDCETCEEYDVRQTLLSEAFEKFEAELNKNTALFILDQLKISDIENISTIAPSMVRKWSSQLLQTSNPYFANSLCYLVGTVVSKAAPEEAKALFLKAEELESFVVIMYKNGLTLQRKSIWSSSNSDVLENLRQLQFDNATSDHEIAMEVLAAETCGRGDFIVDYVNGAFENEHPYIKARAVMVAGFSSQTEQFLGLLKGSALESGLVGDAARISLESHKRCCWAKYWAKRMIDAQNVEAFWCASLLLAKIADGRLMLFLDAQPSLGCYWQEYSKFIDDELKKRAKKWEKKRKETFLGVKSVNHIFV